MKKEKESGVVVSGAYYDKGDRVVKGEGGLRRGDGMDE